jgi:hypothetical protein
MKTTILIPLLIISLGAFAQVDEVKFYKDVWAYITEVEKEMDQIQPEIKAKLEEVGQYAIDELARDGNAKLLLVSTENSRRSHMGQLWFYVAASYYDVHNIETFSGGIEPSEFDFRTVSTLERAGIGVRKNHVGIPKYTLFFSKKGPSVIMYSKKYDDIINPESDFLAVVLSEEADRQLNPFPGADKKVAILTADMEKFDGQTNENVIYDEGCRKIAREMFYLVSFIKNNSYF